MTAAALIAQQVASNALRDALFLTWFEVTTLPYLMAGGAVLAIPAAESSGRLLARFGPARFVPFILAASSALFLAEWMLVGGYPRAVSALFFFHASVLGAIGISTFWSLLNERFDPHSAKTLMAKVAAAGAFGGLAGGVGAERVTVLLSKEAVFGLLGLSGAACVVGSVLIGRGMAARRRRPAAQEDRRSGWAEIRRVPLLRDLALVVGLAAALAAMVDYLAQGGSRQLAWQGRAARAFLRPLLCRDGPHRVLAAGRARPPDSGSARTRRLGDQPSAAGGRGRTGELRCPGTWRAILPRGLDVTLRASIFRAGYELFYTPLPEAAKRAAKSTVDVSADCVGKGGGAALIVLLTRLDPV